MATSKESERVDAHRRQHFDRISVLVDKGGRELFRVLALREGCNMTELVRRAVLARAGLRALPYPDQLEDLKTVDNMKEARAKIRELQNKEAANEIIDQLLKALGGESSTADYSITMTRADAYEIRRALRKISEAISSTAETGTEGPPVTVTLKGHDISVIRRMLANIESQDIDDEW